jgi:hypothetical protein
MAEVDLEFENFKSNFEEERKKIIDDLLNKKEISDLINKIKKKIFKEMMWAKPTRHPGGALMMVREAAQPRVARMFVL